MFFEPTGPRPAIRIKSGAGELDVPLRRAALARRAWPPIFNWKLLVAALPLKDASPSDIILSDVSLFAVTFASLRAEQADRLLLRLSAAADDYA